MIVLYECARCGDTKQPTEVEPQQSGGVVRYVCRDCLGPTGKEQP